MLLKKILKVFGGDKEKKDEPKPEQKPEAKKETYRSKNFLSEEQLAAFGEIDDKLLELENLARKNEGLPAIATKKNAEIIKTRINNNIEEVVEILSGEDEKPKKRQRKN